MRRAELNQVFIYILTILVIGLLLLMGVKYIFLLLERKCETERVLFAKDFEALLDRYTPYQTYVPEQVRLPCGTTALCLVDSRMLPDDCATQDRQERESQFRDAHVPLIASSVWSCVRQNAFLGTALRDGATTRYTDLIPIGFYPLLRLAHPEGELCLSVRRGAASLAFEGLGDATLVVPAEEGP